MGWRGLHAFVRRFDYSIKFSRFSKDTREQIWLSVLNVNHAKDLFSKEQVRNFAQMADVTAGGMTQAVCQAKLLREKASEWNAEDVVKTVLEAQCGLLDQSYAASCADGKEKKSFDDLSTSHSRNYDLSALSIEGDMDRMERVILGFDAI